VAQSESTTVYYAPETKSRSGRKKKTIRISFVSRGDLRDVDFHRKLPSIPEAASFPPLIKLSQLHSHLGISRASVYRMPKDGLRTCRPNGPNGDQHVLREDLLTFLSMRHEQKPRKYR
jgi:hypothetical protein